MARLKVEMERRLWATKSIKGILAHIVVVGGGADILADGLSQHLLASLFEFGNRLKLVKRQTECASFRIISVDEWTFHIVISRARGLLNPSHQKLHQLTFLARLVILWGPILKACYSTVILPSSRWLTDWATFGFQESEHHCSRAFEPWNAWLSGRGAPKLCS